MKSKVTKIISVFLCSCFVLTACFQLIIGVKNLGHNPFQFMPVGSISSQYDSYGKAYDFTDFKLSKNSKSTTEVANEVDENTVMDYTTSLKDLPDSNVNIKVHERIDSMGNLVDVITVNGIVYGEITYNAKGLVVSNTLNYNDVFYEYDDEFVTNLSLNGIEYDYGYVDGKLSNIYLDDDIFSSFEYSNYGKINKETYYYFDRLFEHTNVATI